MRYAIEGLSDETEHLRYDVVVIGAGVAGLYTALQLDGSCSCCILTKEDVDVSSSWLAQGGIAAAISLDDRPAYHLEDTLVAGAGLCDEEAVKVLVSEGPGDIRRLMEMQVPFDLNHEGDLDITREGGHRRNRVVHAGGDATGRETVKALAHLVSLCPNVSFLPHNFCADILTDETGGVTGCAVLDKKDRLYVIDTPNVVLATGGIGQVYKVSTNPSVATGDGLAAAVRAGAQLRDMEFIQFHPTGLWSDREEKRAFLISEAVRGEGGLLKNKKGERFMEGQHELNELAPRDIVARAITRELQESGEDHVFVDITAHSREQLEYRFPTIFAECLKRGLDISRDLIPVCPVQHYLIGGIQTDLYGRTGVEGLYACGEAASTGVHGANRLASNSMLECLVFGRRAAENINRRLHTTKQLRRSLPVPMMSRAAQPQDYSAIRAEIQRLMHQHGGVLRSENGLKQALSQILRIQAELEESYDPGREYLETLNISALTTEILKAALARRESVGAHYRKD